jgi:branched-subunit amino acid ABC-type transport system permease component
MEFVFVLEQVLNGLLIGAYYLLIALGLSLIFSLGGIVNLAHGAFYAIGAYLAVVWRPTSASAGRSSLRRCWWALWAWWSSASCCGASTGATRSTACC